jgi:hypothetical protein
MHTRERLIAFYVLTILVFDIWAMSLAIQGKNNWHVYNILIGLEMLFLTLYLNMILKLNSQKRYLNICCASFFVFSSVYLYINGVNTLMMPLSIVSGLILSFFFLLYLIYGQTGSKWKTNTDNWISLGSIFYLCGTIPFQALFLYLINKKQDLAITLFLVINMGLSHLRFLLILIGILLIIRRKNETHNIAEAT